MVIITTAQFPLEASGEVARRYFEAPEPPDFMCRKGPYFYVNLSGVNVTAVYELDNSRLAEGMDYLGRHFACYFGIPGYKFEFRPSLDINEALGLIGM